METLLAVAFFVPMALTGFLSSEVRLRWLMGMIVGAFSFAFVMEALNHAFHFRPVMGDTHHPPPFEAMIGLLLGSASGMSVLLNKRDKPLLIGGLCLPTALAGLALFSAMLWKEFQTHQPLSSLQATKAIAAFGPGLLWSSGLILRSVWLVRQDTRWHTEPADNTG